MKSIFEELNIKEDSDSCFENAIKKGMKKPYDWMYMFSSKDGTKDYFKHCITRKYKVFKNEVKK